MEIKYRIDNNFSDICKISDKIWGYAETKFKEYRSAQVQIEYLQQNEFTIYENIAGLETAFVAEYGKGKPVITVLGEYDALSGMSQEADCEHEQPSSDSQNGHGCGHNGLGAAGVLAVLSIKEYLQENKCEGTIRYYGCPAEEGGSGKAILVKAGAFDDVDIALTWHPYDITTLVKGSSLANIKIRYHFNGRSSHAANTPHLGRSALDAVELMNVGTNYLREHIIDEARIHYAIINTGGTAPNVIPSNATVEYIIRAPNMEQVLTLKKRVNKVAKGAALMTETEVKSEFRGQCSNYIYNSVIGELIENNLKRYYKGFFTEEEINYTKKYQSIINPQELLMRKEEIQRTAGKEAAERYLNNYDKKLVLQPQQMFGSTDVGDVSWNVPTGQFFIKSYIPGTMMHSWQAVTQGKSPVFHGAIKEAAQILAFTAIDLFSDNTKVQAAKEELKIWKATNQYINVNLNEE